MQVSGIPSSLSEVDLKDIPLGTHGAVRVPASSANLGPGFDSLGLALLLEDEVFAEVRGSGLSIEITGEGADSLPRNERHLVYRAFGAALTQLGYRTPGTAEYGLHLRCINRIPQERGLGSSAAAAVGGIALAYTLVGEAYDYESMIQLAAEFEGHPDNSSASILGGFVLTWSDLRPGNSRQFSATRMGVHPSITVTALIPPTTSSTDETRGILPPTVTREDAVFNISRTAVLTAALTQRPDLLFSGTGDRLHQPQRAGALPTTTRWVELLRSRGYAAVVSGAGPTVLCLHTEPLPSDLITQAQNEGMRVLNLDIADGVRPI